MSRKYRLNVDFDNSVTSFLYDGTGQYSFVVPSVPNFPIDSPTRYVVFLPCVIMLADAGERPAIAGYTRIESGIPSTSEFRTIPVADYNDFLLKDALEFPSASAGASLTVTNLYTIGSTVDPDGANSYSDDRKGCAVYTTKSTGINSDLNLGILKMGEGYIKVNGSENLIITPQTIPVTSDLTASYWHIIYMSTTGVYSIQETTDNDYPRYPFAELDSKAPVNATKTARYKSTDPNLRAVAVAFSTPTIADYAGGTTYARGAMAVEGTTVYISLVGSNTGHTPSSSPTFWAVMGTEARIFSPKVYNLPEEIFGSGQLGDVTLNGTGLGATATPFYGTDEAPEYEFNNLTISGVCYCGNTDGLSFNPVTIRVKGTLTIGASGQLNGTIRGKSGGTGGTGGTGTFPGGAGGAGGKSGRPIHIYANKIVNNNTGYWLVSKGEAGNNGANGTGGAGGGGCINTSGILVISNSKNVSNIDKSVLPSVTNGGVGGSCNGSAVASVGGGLGVAYGVVTLAGGLGGIGFGFGGGGGGGNGNSIAAQNGYGGAGGCSGGSRGSTAHNGGGGSGKGGKGAVGGFGVNGGDGGDGHAELNYVVIIESYDSREAI